MHLLFEQGVDALLEAFFLAFFAAPASQLRNDYLNNERGMGGGDIAIFSLVTYAPWAFGVFLAGRIADIRGRRPVAILGVLGGALFTVLGYSTAGVANWPPLSPKNTEIAGIECFRVARSILLAVYWTGFKISTPISIKSGISEETEP